MYFSSWYVYIISPINKHKFTQHSTTDRKLLKVIFKQSKAVLNSIFHSTRLIFLTKAKEISLSYYLPIAEERINRFIAFPRALARSETQIALCRTLVVDSRYAKVRPHK